MTKFSEKLDSFVDKLKHECSLNSSDIERLLGCSLNAKLSTLPMSNVHQLLDKIHVSLEAVSEDSVDFGVIRDRLVQSPVNLASRYLEGVQSSSRFTTAYMADFIHKTKGTGALHALHKHFQFDAELTKNHGLTNNIRLPRDICNYVARYYGVHEVEAMGEHSLSLLRHKISQYGLERSRNWQEFLLRFIAEITPRMVERNYSWTIAGITSNRVYIQGRPSSEFAECFPELIRTTKSMEYLRLGYIRGLLTYFDSAVYEITQIKSLFNGQDCDLYEIHRISEPGRESLQ